MKLHFHPALILATLGLAIAQPAAAADEAWKHTVVIYGVGASIDGKVGAGDLSTEIDLGFDDILDNLHMGAMGAYRAERGPWAVTLDVMWLNLQNDKGGLGPQGETWREIELDQFISELDIGYALNERLSAYGGLRYWDVDTEVTVVLGPPLSQTLSGRLSEDWIDPVIGLRYLQPLGANWTLMLRSDIGGFGVGSDFTWHITGLASWNLSEHASLLFGFRYLDLDYDDGTGSSRFLMDLSEGGPTAGFAWRF
jgi:hypothetical protein